MKPGIAIAISRFPIKNAMHETAIPAAAIASPRSRPSLRLICRIPMIPRIAPTRAVSPIVTNPSAPNMREASQVRSTEPGPEGCRTEDSGTGEAAGVGAPCHSNLKTLSPNLDRIIGSKNHRRLGNRPVDRGRTAGVEIANRVHPISQRHFRLGLRDRVILVEQDTARSRPPNVMRSPVRSKNLPL